VRVNWWAAIIAIWTAWWTGISIWITVFDLPPGSTYWSWCIDTTGYWHELALPLMSWLSGLAVIVVVMLSLTLRDWMNELREFLKMMMKGV